MFSKLLKYASSIDSRSKKLVLDVMKIVGEFPGNNDGDAASGIAAKDTPPIVHNDNHSGRQNISHPGNLLFFCYSSPFLSV
jgi:hypothetical protein